jgi:LAO/AO transport system kinase
VTQGAPGDPAEAIGTLAAGVIGGDRVALARAITLVESTRPQDRAAAGALLDRIMDHTGHAIRVGISGAPGVGKSTFIESIGLHITASGRKVAVLAVDPSSVRSGGSILGDKTRMARLANDPDAFIRPSPSSGTLGGVARRTREAMLLCEAAGYGVCLIETVGVGQSEVAVAEMVDCFALLLAPGAGDELQGIKRGIAEVADLVVVNKADGDLEGPALVVAAEYASAVRLMRPRFAAWTPKVLLCSAHEETGIGDVWETVVDHDAALRASGDLERTRAAQARDWMWSELRANLLDTLRRDPKVAAVLGEVEAAVAAGTLSPTSAAERLLHEFLPDGH